MSGGGDVHLERVWIDGALGAGAALVDKGTTLDMASSLITGTRSTADGAAGVIVGAGAALTTSAVRLSMNEGVGLSVEGGSSAHLAQSLVDDTQPRATDGHLGVGILVADGAALKVERVRVAGNAGKGITAAGPGATVTATGLVVDGTVPPLASESAAGLEVLDGATVELWASRLVGNVSYGLSVFGEGTTVEATALMIDGNVPRTPTAPDGYGAVVGGGAVVTLDTVRFDYNAVFGLYVSGDGTRVVGERVRLDDTLEGPTSATGCAGIAVLQGAELDLKTASLVGNAHLGLYASGGGTVARVTNLLVNDSKQAVKTHDQGGGIAAWKGATIELDAVRLAYNHTAAVYANGKGTLVRATNLLADGTKATQATGVRGYGVEVDEGATVELRASRVTGSHHAGLAAGSGGRIRGSGVLVDGTIVMSLNQGDGEGAAAFDGGEIVLEASRLTANHTAGAAAYRSRLVLIGTLVDSNLPQDEGRLGGVGINGVELADIVLEGSRFTANHASGVFVTGPAAQLTARDILVDGTLPSAKSSANGSGMELQFASTADLDAVRLSGNLGMGLGIAHPGTLVRARGLLIDGTRGEQATQLYGYGLQIALNARLELRSSRLSGNRTIGVLAIGEDTVTRLWDVLVDDTQAPVNDTEAQGGIFEQSGQAALYGVRLHGNRSNGLYAHGVGASVDGVGVAIRGTQERESDHTQGVGVWSAVGATVALRSSILAENRGTNMAFGGGSGSIDGCALIGARWSELGGAERGGLAGGEDTVALAHGIVGSGAATIDVTRSLVAANPGAGLLLQATDAASVGGSVISGGFYGVVTQGLATVTEDANALFDNVQDRVSDAGLTVPESPPPADPASIFEGN